MGDHTFTVTRRIDIAATPERIHGLIDNFAEWRRWSPWEDLDPAMTRTYGGPVSGVGSTYTWSGNRKAGRGRMSIVASSPEQVDVDLDFSAPMAAHNRTTFRLTPHGDTTRVEWTMTGPLGLVMRLFNRVRSMDRLVGRDFEKGLASLKRVSEEG